MHTHTMCTAMHTHTHHAHRCTHRHAHRHAHTHTHHAHSHAHSHAHRRAHAHTHATHVPCTQPRTGTHRHAYTHTPCTHHAHTPSTEAQLTLVLSSHTLSVSSQCSAVVCDKLAEGHLGVNMKHPFSWGTFLNLRVSCSGSLVRRAPTCLLLRVCRSPNIYLQPFSVALPPFWQEHLLISKTADSVL